MCIEFTHAADPSSVIFQNMASSRRTIVRRMTDIYSYMCDEIKEDIQKGQFFSVMADESMDSSISEQLIVYLRYVDIAKECITVLFSRDLQD